MERLVRWSWELNAYRFRVVHIASEENVVADLLSRWGNSERAQTLIGSKKVLAAKYGISPVARYDAIGGVRSEPKARLVNSAKAAQMALAERPSNIYEVPRPWEFLSVEKRYVESKKNSLTRTVRSFRSIPRDFS